MKRAVGVLLVVTSLAAFGACANFSGEEGSAQDGGPPEASTTDAGSGDAPNLDAPLETDAPPGSYCAGKGGFCDDFERMTPMGNWMVESFTSGFELTIAPSTPPSPGSGNTALRFSFPETFLVPANGFGRASLVRSIASTSESFTAELWVRYATLPAARVQIFTITTTMHTIAIAVEPSGLAVVHDPGAASEARRPSTDPAALTTWTKLTLTLSEAGGVLLVRETSGQPAEQMPLPTGLLGAVTTARVGLVAVNPANNQLWQAFVDDVVMPE